ncbi:MAG TPA: hypothetical protein VKV95_00560 [Terriglobia bacterium]|nr:hypothetical protein [Terriglobia bacterium]
MRSKFQKFTQEAEFQADPGAVREAIRAFAANWLAGWNLSETPDGVEATGQSGGHRALAMFRIDPVTTGARLVVTLQVEQSGSRDREPDNAGQDNDDLIHKWMDAIPWWIEQKKTAAPLPAGGQEKAFLAERPKRRRLRIREIVASAFLICWILVITIYALSGLVGLVTGELKLPSRRSGDLVTTYGWVARIESVLILAFYGWIVYSMWKWRKQHKGEPWI